MKYDPELGSNCPVASASTRTLLIQLEQCEDLEQKLRICARTILAVFDDFHAVLGEYPERAKRAFEMMDPQESVKISHERLNLYSHYVRFYGQKIKAAFPDLQNDESLLDTVDGYFRPLIAARYEADIAFGFCHSIRRNIYHGIWRPVAYTFSRPVRNRYMSLADVHQRFELIGGIDTTLLTTVLQIPRFKAPFRDLDQDVQLVVNRWQELMLDGVFEGAEPIALDVLEAGFYRDLSAFLVGRMEWKDGSYTPFVLAMKNSPEGIYIDALLHQTADAHNLFSSTLANFHVTNPFYYQICRFLYTLMPRRPLGLHYSTIGFNHVGKVAILTDIEQQLKESGACFNVSPGAEGTVAIGFTFDDCQYHMKVIRDKPTKAYKWGEFAGVEAVLDKYRIVHEINRTGSMLDNVMYFHVRMDRDWFCESLVDDLARNATQSVQVEDDYLLFRALIVQMKMTPLPIYFETATEEETEQVIENLGHCIKNNMSANIFNMDLDGRNYGVGRYGKVFLFDYDALEKLTEVELDTNVDRIDGDEDIPDWFFSDQPVFLPEELESGLQLTTQHARKSFRRNHAELLQLPYWLEAQRRLQRGEVLDISTYPDARKLGHDLGSGSDNTELRERDALSG